MAESKVARFRQEQAAKQGMYGLAVVTSLTARLERGTDYLLTLLAKGKPEELALLMETPIWGREEESVSYHTPTSG